ncbi:MipA/OmpV family protein [Brevundimonas balnearis]|uniref:MipA/OmpV family protein n=1 Tax=Brevundimonas balnearis TaxID=1572858 RepID=A0ABV6R488_9CAUL
MRPCAPVWAALPLVLATAALAQEGPGPQDRGGGFIAVGPGATPEYDGADTLRIVPFVASDVRWNGLDVQVRGLGGRVDVASDPRLAVGPVVNIRLGRDDVDGPVGRLADIDAAVELGGFIAYRIGGGRDGQGALTPELSVVQDISDGHGGLLATAGASYALVRRRSLAVDFDLRATWVDDDYSVTYFGVDAIGAAASGLAEYRPGSGVRDIGVGVTAAYWFTQSLGLLARAGASYLLDEAAESPIVEDGARWQPTVGLALAYRF